MTTDTADQLLTIDDLLGLARQVVAPPKALAFWDWCVTELRLPGGRRFDPRRAALMRPWYDLLGARISGQPLPHDPEAHLVEQVWLVLCSQIAKTTLLNALLLWTAAHYPRKIGFFMDRLKDLKDNHSTRLLPMIQGTDAVDALLPQTQEARERALNHRLYQIAASFAFFLCGSVGDDWRSQDLELLLEDEFDVYPDDVDGQGDPIDLGQVRQRTYPHTRLTVGTSTPTAVARHAWRRLNTGTHERPICLCPSCGGWLYLSRRGIVLIGGRKLIDVDETEIRTERLARYVCHHCGEMHDDGAVRAMVVEAIRAGRWIPGTWDNPDEHPQGIWTPAAEVDDQGRLGEIPRPVGRIRTGWAGSLYSVDVTLTGHACGWAKAQRGTEDNRKAWVNTEDAEPHLFVITGTSVEEIESAAVRSYAPGGLPELPVAIVGLLLVFDQQGNHRERYWWPWSLHAFAQGGEHWTVAAGKVMSEAERDELEERLWPIGRQMRAADYTIMDFANPNARPDIYLWANEDRHRRILLRGDGELATEDRWVEVEDSTPSRRKRRTGKPPGVRAYRIHPHLWRGILQERMLGELPPGWHLPSGLPDEVLKSLNAEEPEIELRRIRGQGWQEVVVWNGRITSRTNDTVTRRKDLHWADNHKMALAAAEILGWTDAPAPTRDGVAPGPAPVEQSPIDEYVDDSWASWD